MTLALLVTMLTLGIAAFHARTSLPAPFVTRLQEALRADVFVLAWLAAAIANVARLRFFSSNDIGGSSEAPSAQIARACAILQNTFEQAGLAAFAGLIAAATFERSHETIIASVWLFSLGRLLFWRGYRHGARSRAFGFALTFYPSVAVLLASVVCLLLNLAAR